MSVHVLIKKKYIYIYTWAAIFSGAKRSTGDTVYDAQGGAEEGVAFNSIRCINGVLV